MNLLATRFLIGIADRTKRLQGLNALKNRSLAQRSEMVMSKYRDVGADTADLVNSACRASSDFEIQGYSLKAFWLMAATTVRIIPVSSRLLINPPTNLASLDDYQVTVNSQPFLTGRYGSLRSSENALKFSNVERAQVTGEHRGFFQDITIFWLGQTMDLDGITELILPGSTITLHRPAQKIHRDWVEWAGLDLTFEAALQRIEKVFNIRAISTISDQQAEVETVILGIEAK